ncbi:MAG: polysaccharide deacetylase family protein [Patescibacteria group bacterium]|jgi:peptidoglycan/xylan/chitin deacetylase (PgdA/CDA1 family)
MKATKSVFLIIIIIFIGICFFGFIRNARIKSDQNIINNEDTSWQAPDITEKTIEFTDEEKKDQEYLSTLPVKPIEKGSIRVPILLYHKIGTPKEGEETSYYVSPEKFELQMRWLALNNYRVISLDALVNYLTTGKNKPTDKSIVITFDDGTIGQYQNAFPILKQYHYNATFFMVPSWLDKGSVGTGSDYMSWNNALEMAKYGMIIGSHNMTHRDMNAATDDEINYELSESKKILEEKLEIKIKNYAYPGGSMGARAIAKVSEFGYQSASSVNKEIDHNKNDLFILGRMHIDNDLPYFIARIEDRWSK